MNEKIILTSLPFGLSHNILSDWLDLKSLKVFDTACCNKSARADLHEAIRSDEILSYQKILEISDKCFTWMKNRSASARIIVVEDGMFSGASLGETAGYLLHFGAYVQTLKILRGHSAGYLDIVNSIAEICHNLKSVTYTCGMFAELNLSVLCELLKSTSNVKQLCIDFVHSDYSFEEFGRLLPLCRGLRALRVASTGINDEVLCAFATGCSQIAHLDLEQCGGITDVGIEGVAVHLKGLQSLNITNCFSLTSQSLEHLSTHCAHSLHTLHFNIFTDQGLTYSHSALNKLFDTCVNIRKLCWVENGTTTSFPLPASIRNVTTLILVDEAVTDANLITVAKNCTNLVHMYLECSDNIESIECIATTLTAVVTQCAHLQEVTINGFYDHDFPGFEELVDSWRELRPEVNIREEEKGPPCFNFDVMEDACPEDTIIYSKY